MHALLPAGGIMKKMQLDKLTLQEARKLQLTATNPHLRAMLAARITHLETRARIERSAAKRRSRK
jgi:hypothetical protein